MYLKGDGVPEDIQLAAMWAAVAIMNGSYKAELLLTEAQEQLVKRAWDRAAECIENAYVGCERNQPAWPGLVRIGGATPCSRSKERPKTQARYCVAPRPKRGLPRP